MDWIPSRKIPGRTISNCCTTPFISWRVWERSSFSSWRLRPFLYLGRLESTRSLLWILMLAFPFPYIANTVGWMTAELGRQPWLVFGLFRTDQGFSKSVSAGSTIFTLMGFCGLYFVLGVLFLYLVGREIEHGPKKRPGKKPGRKRGRLMVEIWYTILAFTLMVYLVLDGRNFGAG